MFLFCGLWARLFGEDIALVFSHRQPVGRSHVCIGRGRDKGVEGTFLLSYFIRSVI